MKEISVQKRRELPEKLEAQPARGSFRRRDGGKLHQGPVKHVGGGVRVAEDKSPSKSVTFRFHESQQFHVVHVDGIFGGPTPGGLLYATLFTQLPPLPYEVTHEVLPTGALGKELSRIPEVAIPRRVEVGLLMDLNMCQAMRDWLSTQVEILQGLGKSK
jgi:hypothetical protein